MNDQFLKQRRDIQHETSAGKGFTQFGQEIKRPHGNPSRHSYSVEGFRWNPDSAQRRNDPNALIRVDGHCPFCSKEKLVLGMRMTFDDVPVLEIPRTARNVRQMAALLVKEEEMARSRHCLSR
jgi:hypothetical protein